MDIQERIEDLTLSLQAVSSLNPSFIQSVDHYRQIFATFIAHHALWYEVLGSKAPIRILLLNQNSDELRAGGGFPGTAFVMEWDG